MGSKGTRIFLDMEGKATEVWPKLGRYEVKDGDLVAMGTLPFGTEGGKPAVCLLVEVDGQKVIVQTTLRTFQLASAMFLGKFGDVTDGQHAIKIGPDGLELESK